MRRRHSRKHLRYETDLTDGEWAIIAPYLPGSPVLGRPHKWSMREIMNAIFYVLRGGVAWSLLPREFPPRSTVFHWFSIFRDTCLFEKIHHALVIADRERRTAGVCAGKKLRGRKRHALVDTDGRGLLLEPHPADVQDRDAARTRVASVTALLSLHRETIRRQRL